jgi:hypothetical protein
MKRRQHNLILKEKEEIMKNKKKPWILTSDKTKRERFAKLSKEDRLKQVGKHYIEIGFSIGKVVGGGLKEKKSRETYIGVENLFKKTIGKEFTWSLKRAGVLPL